MIEELWADDSEIGAPTQRPILSMAATRKIEYAVRHTERHVFDINEPTLFNAIGSRKTLLVIDEALWPLYGAGITSYSNVHLACAGVLRLAGDESTKCLEEVVAVCSRALDLGLPRDGAMLAIGGGTILDMVGFAASIYRRGVDFVRVPTTLIGMIDVGVGIKQAVNFGSKKNALGSFYPPLVTINDRTFLASLSQRDLACGIAEALKMALICDSQLFLLLEEYSRVLVKSNFRTPPDVALEVLLRAEMTMMDQLQPNLFEHELRRLVDFGHTFSPIIEIASGYAVPHGEAVALDMLLSIAIAIGRHVCDPAMLSRLIRIYRGIDLPTFHGSMRPETMERALAETRAHRGGYLNFVVPTIVGEAIFLQDVIRNEIESGLDRLMSVAQST